MKALFRRFELSSLYTLLLAVALAAMIPSASGQTIEFFGGGSGAIEQAGPGRLNWTEDPPATLAPWSELYGTDAFGKFAPLVVMGDAAVHDDPGMLIEFRSRENLGKSFMFRVTGSADASTIWGTEIYTDDSPLARTAVHAGLVEPGETKVVLVTILPGRNTYKGSTSGEVTSASYGPWHGSYMIDEVRPSPSATSAATAPSSMSDISGGVGDTFTYEITGSTEGYVWGVGVYTDDSTLAAVVVHAGVVEPGETATIKVTLLPGRNSYGGSESNGVASRPYGGYSRSYMVEREGSAVITPQIETTFQPSVRVR